MFRSKITGLFAHTALAKTESTFGRTAQGKCNVRTAATAKPSSHDTHGARPGAPFYFFIIIL